MQERKTVTKALAEQYRRASKGQKGVLLDQFVEATGYDRCYARRLLRNHGRQVRMSPKVVVEGDARVRTKRKGKITYGPEVRKALVDVWEILDFISSKRLAAALPEVVPRLVAFRELRIKKAVQRLLLRVSPATIDRLLKPERGKHTIKGQATTKPGTLLKHQVPIRTFSDWDDERPGFLEMDLVGHDGGRAEGDYCFTLDLTDVATGWTELVAVQNKAQKWVFEGLQELRKRLPFAVLGFDSDNGSEFINHHLVAYCKEQQITFTRSRPYRKNDTCYVEQKNWSVVRRFVGYARYDTPEVCKLLNNLYQLLRDYSNFFLPSMKLKEKIRDGAKVLKRYDTPQTPYQRILASSAVPNSVKQRLTRYYEQLNPAALYRQIRRLQKQLDKAVAHRKRQEAA
jgi:hypothetical protein